MISSLKRRSLSKPEKGVKIHAYDLSFVRGRNKNKAHSLLLELFDESELSKADLAKMLGKKPEQITRWLAGPGNLTLETLSDLVFAMTGQFVSVQCKDDLSKAKSNRQPVILHTQMPRETSWRTVAVSPHVKGISESRTPKIVYSLPVEGAKNMEKAL